jgi:hypothetical protein
MNRQRRYTARRNEELVRVSYRVPVSIDETVEKLAREEGVTMSVAVAKLVSAGAKAYAHKTAR